MIIPGLTLLLYIGRTTTFDAMYITAAVALVTTTVQDNKDFSMFLPWTQSAGGTIKFGKVSCGIHCTSQKLLLWTYIKCSTMVQLRHSVNTLQALAEAFTECPTAAITTKAITPTLTTNKKFGWSLNRLKLICIN